MISSPQYFHVNKYNTQNIEVQVLLRKADVVVCVSEIVEKLQLSTRSKRYRKITIGCISNINCYRKVNSQIQRLFSKHNHSESIIDDICCLIQRSKEQTLGVARKEAERFISLMQGSKDRLKSEMRDYMDLKSIDLRCKESCKDLIDVLSLIADKSPELLIENLRNFKFNPKTEGGSVIYLGIAKILVMRNCSLLAENVCEFNFNPKTVSGRKALVEIARLIIEKAPAFFVINIEKFGLDVKKTPGERALVILARDIANLCPEFLIKQIDKFKFQLGSYNGERSFLEIAKVIAKKPPVEWLKTPKVIRGLNLNPVSKKFWSVCKQIIHQNLKLKSMVHLSAEHLSLEDFYKNQDSFALHSLIELLESIKQDVAGKIGALDRIIPLLKGAEDVSKGNDILKLINKIKKMVARLHVGELFFLNSSVQGHAMAMVIKCTHKNIYKVTLHNEGDGLLKYHYKKIFKYGSLFQTALEFVNVRASYLYGNGSHFFENIVNNRTVELDQGLNLLYKTILPSLFGRRLPESSNPRLWSKGQVGLSCTTSCWMSVIRSMLTVKQFNYLDGLIKRKSLAYLSSPDLIVNLDDRSKKICILEIVRSLQSKQSDQMSPSALNLNQMEAEMEDWLAKSVPLQQQLRLSAEDDLETLWLQIQQGCYSKETKQACTNMIQRFLKKPFSLSAVKKQHFIESFFYQQMAPVIHISQTREHLGFVTGFLAIISRQFKKIDGFTADHADALESIIQKTKQRIFALNLYQTIDKKSDFGKMFHRCLNLL